MLYRGPIAATTLHEHHAFQVMLSSERLRVAALGAGDDAGAFAFVVPPDRGHAILAPVRDALVLWIDPDEDRGRQLRAALGPMEGAASWGRAAQPLVDGGILPASMPRQPLSLATTILAALGAGSARPEPLHPAVRATLHRVRSGQGGTSSVEDLARAAGISAGRLSHVFREQVGTSLRVFILWSRLQRAVEEVRRGASLTEAAHAAGFSDSAHMSRSFRRMFGIAPSEAVGRVDWSDGGE